MRDHLLNAIDDCIKAVEQLKWPSTVQFLEQLVKALESCFRTGHKVIIAGNGGSLCDASHFAEEMTGFFRKKRPALPVIPLSDAGHLTCTANDIGFEWVFARGVEAYGKSGDLFIGLTTSGNSANLIRAFEVANQMGLKTVAFLGKGGGKLKGIATLEWIVEEFSTSDRIQEAHMAAMHLVIEQVEYALFENLRPAPQIQHDYAPV